MSEACSEVVVSLVVRDRRQVASDLVALTKPRVVVMVLVTTLVATTWDSPRQQTTCA